MTVEQPQHTEQLTAFYRDWIMPLAENAAAANVVIFPMDPDVGSESYFKDRADGESYIHAIDSDDLETELRKLWANDTVPDIEAIVVPLLSLAEIIREKEQTSDEVSPFIYAMF